MKKELIEKAKQCKALQGKTVLDLIQTDEFERNLAAYMKAQFEDRNAIHASFVAMRKLGGAKGYKLPAHPIDKVMHLSVAEMALEYAKIISKQSALPAAQRTYVWQLGQQAYNKTMIDFVVAEFPEMKDVLFPKAS